MARTKSEDVSIGKFDIIATYTYAKGLLDGLADDEARERGMVAAVMGAKARLGQRSSTHQEDYKSQKEAAEKKKKTTITAESFGHQVSDNMGGYFGKTFLPNMKRLIKADLSYDEVKNSSRYPRLGERRSAARRSRSG